jgi:CDP-diacylglycerol--glycerol-3-phosphate 3-phosphatidyltransferase/CDP-diacylglycerol--inositol 3-phosphatidyltransferase
MMLNRFREFWTRLFAPVAHLLLRLGVSPDAVTLIGTAGVCAGALAFFPRGQFFVGGLVVAVFALADLIDGYMARTAGRSSRWGAFLDSSLDRLGDGAIFGGLVLWYAGAGDHPVLTALSLYVLVMGSLTSYVRARAEALGYQAKVGLAERADRLVSVLAAAWLSDLLDLPALLAVVLWWLAFASTVTVVQRVLVVRRQAWSSADAKRA